MSEDLSAARAYARWKIGRAHEAEALLQDAAAEREYDAILGAATQAGRLADLEQTWTYARGRVKGERLEGYVGRSDLLAYLLPYAMSDPAYVRRRFPRLAPREVAEVVSAARRESPTSRRRALDEYLDETRRRLAEVGEQVRRGRIRVDTSARDLSKVNPLQQDGEGRWARLVGRRSSRNPFSRAGKRVSRFWRSMGGNVAQREVETHEDAALRTLKERYGVEVITPEREARMRERERNGRLATRLMRKSAALPYRTLWGAFKVGTVGGVLTLRTRRLQRAMEATPDRSERQELAREIEHLNKRNPWRLYGIRNLRSLLRVLPVGKLLLVLLLVGSALVTLGWSGSLVMSLQAVFALVAAGLNFLVALLNAGLVLGMGTLYVVGNFALGMLNGAMGVLYDGVWKSIGQFVPDASYAKPFFTMSGLGIPQVSYLISVFHVDIDEQGDKSYGMPVFLGVDAEGNPTGSFFWSTTGYQLPQFEHNVLTCERVDDQRVCQSFYERLRDGGGGWLANLACRLAPEADYCEREAS